MLILIDRKRKKPYSADAWKVCTIGFLLHQVHKGVSHEERIRLWEEKKESDN